MAENCVCLHIDGGLKGVGQAMSMKTGGFLGLETASSTNVN